MAFNSFYSAYLLRSNNYLLSTHSHWSPCIYNKKVCQNKKSPELLSPNSALQCQQL